MTTKYEIEKGIAASLPALNGVGLELARTEMKLFLLGKNCRYLMLLSNELKYYTIFRLYGNLLMITDPSNNIVDFLLNDSFLKTLGELKVFEINDDNIEIWIGEHYFSLFECDSFIVNV